ncbi:hypothetical protein K7432_007434, partial [Basidiobolus ranarum]
LNSKMPSEELVIKSATQESLKIIYQWGDNEGWNPGVHDWKTMYSTNPDGYFVGHLNDKPICCIAIFRYSHQVSYIGWYIVLKEYRGHGYGLTMFKYAMNLLKGYNIGLDGVVAQQSNYAKFGFVRHYDNEVYDGEFLGGINSILPLQDLKFVTMEHVSVDKIAEFEYEQTGILRLKWWKAWLEQPDLTTLALLDDKGSIVATVNSRLTGNGSQSITHLYATDAKYADAILVKSLKSLQSSVGDEKPLKYHLTLNNKNPQCNSVIEKFHLKHSISFGRMWTNGLPTGTKNENVYLSGSPECG